MIKKYDQAVMQISKYQFIQCFNKQLIISCNFKTSVMENRKKCYL